jgi:hypothetical protein
MVGEIGDTDGPSTIVRFAGILLIGIIILSGLDNGVHSQMIESTQMIESITFTFDGQPSNGDTVTISGHVFEFDSGDGVISGHIPVTIGGTITRTVENLKIAAESA